ncbi:hypothetical protein GOP47_0005876 [Adiantum capillus-veneris]|uniref:Protein kinase domain-containing protein n=1 Tax=Adiantum capillus-veneris TaxID=13818 RepID=A0A9D4ZMI8_ADICA|nr:hypothetical protein GOP47_0005876 [Adiantum capillus-veneris]
MLLLWFTVLAIFLWSSLTTALQFQYASFQDEAAVGNSTSSRSAIKVVSTQADWYGSSGVNAYFNGTAIWLTAFQNSSLNGATEGNGTNVGRVVYKDPIQFTNTNTSFATSFTFQIITTRPFPNCGSGMAFFIADSLQAPRDSDTSGSLGLLDPSTLSPDATSSSSSFFAVEFDTRISNTFRDPSASHIGIDVNTLRSLNVTDTTSSFYPQLFLYNNSTFTTWIEYDASTYLIQVWMANVSSASTNSSGAASTLVQYDPVDRPLYPCLQLQYNLSAVFSQKLMYMGFSATSAPSNQGMQGHAIYSWSFSNELVTTAPSSPTPSRKFKLYVALTVAFAALLLILVMVWALLTHRRNQIRKRASAAARVENALQTARPFSYKELRKATNGFDEKRKVGEGGYGSVYKGIMADGSVVAVKKLRQSLTLEDQFCAEASIIRKVRHRYLLELQGWCYEDGHEALLVSEFMSKGSLDGYLFDASKKKQLAGKTAAGQTETRMQILKQVAAALEYLHGGLGECVLHRDVKAGNVLLTDSANEKQVEARLCDFGLARLIRHEEGAVAMTAAGTPGYVAPELLYCGMATDKVDVFSFGVLALETACGRRAISKDYSQHIYDWLWATLDNIDQSVGISDHQLRRVLDPILITDDNDVAAQQVLQDWRCVVHVGLMCCHAAAACRPSMKEVSRALESRSALPLPKVKPPSPFEYYGPSSASNTITASTLAPTASASSDSGPPASLLSAPR